MMGDRKRRIALTVASTVPLLLAGCAAADLPERNAQQTVALPAPQTQACDTSTFRNLEAARIQSVAEAMIDAPPRTITADRAERSTGGQHDFYSEGDYWWPVPGDPDAPYEQRDGQTNPDNFVAHRLSMMRLSDHVGSMVSAWRATGEQRYADSALRHLRAWFVEPDTRMAPRLLYAQAIKGRHTGRSIGLIDTLHLVETARGAKLLIEANAIPAEDADAIKAWFDAYAEWMNTHPYGIEERDWYNNHSIAWSLQVAAFADLAGREDLLELVRSKFKTVYLPQMMDERGGFPEELSRTKPYGYSLFVLDLMAGVATIGSSGDEDLWAYTTDDGKSMRRGVEFLLPYVGDKAAWPYRQDIQYWNDWPVRHPFLILGAVNLPACDTLGLAQKLPPSSEVYEVRRNWPIRHPLLWLD